MSDPAQNDHDPHSSSSPPFSGLSSSAPVSTSTSSPIQLLKVQVPGTNCSDHQISIQLTPATPTSSQCSEAGHLLASVKPPILTNQRTSNQIACFNHRIDLTASNDSMATPTLAKRMLPGPSNYDRINIGDPDELTVQGYILSKTKKCFFYLGVICTFGLLMLYAEWQPELKVKLTHSCCPLDEADVLILKVIKLKFKLKKKSSHIMY